MTRAFGHYVGPIFVWWITHPWLFVGGAIVAALVWYVLSAGSNDEFGRDSPPPDEDLHGEAWMAAFVGLLVGILPVTATIAGLAGIVYGVGRGAYWLARKRARKRIISRAIVNTMVGEHAPR